MQREHLCRRGVPSADWALFWPGPDSKLPYLYLRLFNDILPSMVGFTSTPATRLYPVPVISEMHLDGLPSQLFEAVSTLEHAR